MRRCVQHSPMAESDEWAFPEEMRPQADDARFDLEAALDAVVLLRSEVPEDAFTAQILGTERAGNGVVIRDGLVLTIGYLITEANAVWLTTNHGNAVAGFPLAYDYASGFGLVQPLGRLELQPLECGSCAGCGISRIRARVRLCAPACSMRMANCCCSPTPMAPRPRMRSTNWSSTSRAWTALSAPAGCPAPSCTSSVNV